MVAVSCYIVPLRFDENLNNLLTLPIRIKVIFKLDDRAIIAQMMSKNSN